MDDSKEIRGEGELITVFSNPVVPLNQRILFTKSLGMWRNFSKSMGMAASRLEGKEFKVNVESLMSCFGKESQRFMTFL